MTRVLSVPMVPGSQTLKEYAGGVPPLVEALSEWIYSEVAIERFRLKIPIPIEYRKYAPKHWVDNGWVEELDGQIDLFDLVSQ